MTRLAGFGVLECPPEIVAGLRAIDPLAELIHLGDAEWMLMVRKPNDHARDEVDKQLKTIATVRNEVVDVADRARVDLEMAKELQLLQLFGSGYRPIHIYAVGQGQPYASLHAIVADFRERDFNWRFRPDAAFAELQDAISLDAGDARRTAVVLEKVRQDAKSMFRYVMRGARSVVVQGFRAMRPSSLGAHS